MKLQTKPGHSPYRDQRSHIPRALHDSVIPVARGLVQRSRVRHLMYDRPEYERRIEHDEVPPHLSFVFLPEGPRGALSERLARAVLLRVGRGAALALDSCDARLVPVLLGEEPRLARGREYGGARGRDHDAVDGLRCVRERGGEYAGRAAHGGDDEL